MKRDNLKKGGDAYSAYGEKDFLKNCLDKRGSIQIGLKLYLNCISFLRIG